MFSYRTLCSVFELVKKTEDILVSDIEFEFLSFAVLLLEHPDNSMQNKIISKFQNLGG